MRCERDAFDALFDHAPDKLQVVKKVCLSYTSYCFRGITVNGFSDRYVTVCFLPPVLETVTAVDGNNFEKKFSVKIIFLFPNNVSSYSKNVKDNCTKFYKIKYELIFYRFCGPVVRVPGCRSRGPGSIPDATRFSEK
jgi:hypothetical protein